MDLRNSFEALDPNHSGFIELATESEPEEMEEGAALEPRDEMEVDEGVGDGFADNPNAMEVECPFPFFSRQIDKCPLPYCNGQQGSFDYRVELQLGDPGIDYEGTQSCEYEVSGSVGEPHWDRIFECLLRQFAHIRLFQTVFVLVDDRDLTAPHTVEASLAHWPTVAAWWASRLALHGPARELCDLIFVPIGPSAGLEHVHPTWAGTFVLSALVFLFPGVHFVLLDSDCVPVTLFEVADLWKELSLLRDGLTSTTASLSRSKAGRTSEGSVSKASKLSHDQWKHQTVGQGVLLVTEHNAEVNAGFIVAFASSHQSVISEQRWRELLRSLEDEVNIAILQQEVARIAELYWHYTSEFLATRRTVSEMDLAERTAWIQTGLALTPFVGCDIRHTCDWTIAWSVIGEWTSQEIFLPPAGQWPRNGHSKNLLEEYDYRRPIASSHGLERVLSKDLFPRCFTYLARRYLESYLETRSSRHRG